MTVIYVDTLFLLNGIIDYLLLLAAAPIPICEITKALGRKGERGEREERSAVREKAKR